MGRHGGGSRSGGSSSSRSSGGSRSGGSGSRSSSRPFSGSYNRSYYDRRGRYHSYYTTNSRFGEKSGWNAGIIFALLFVTVHMCLMLTAALSSCVFFGKKVDGDSSRIFIEDRANILTVQEEREIIDLFLKVYDKSGMPITLYTEDFGWKEHYRSLEAYSEELYYRISFDEDAMVILFTVEEEDDFVDWEYDMYCGDDTIKCFSDESFDELIENFQKAMSRQDLAEALDYSWNSVIDDLAEIKIGSFAIVALIFVLAFYSIFYIAILGSVRKQNEAYRYFRENPGELSSSKVSMEGQSSSTAPSYGYSSTPVSSYGGVSANRGAAPQMMSTKTCSFCGISNDGAEKICSFCGAILDENSKNTTK